MKTIGEKLFDRLLEAAESSPRRRMHYDLRTQSDDKDENWQDLSQRMLNVMMKDTVIPIHRHNETSETVIVLKGSGEEVSYDEHGKGTQRVKLEAGGFCCMVQVPRGTYHTFIPLENGTVIFEAKDRPYDPELTEDSLPV